MLELLHPHLDVFVRAAIRRIKDEYNAIRFVIKCSAAHLELVIPADVEELNKDPFPRLLPLLELDCNRASDCRSKMV